MSYIYEIKQLETPFSPGVFEWAVVESTPLHVNKEYSSRNTTIIGIFADEELAKEFAAKRAKHARQQANL